MPKYKNKYCFSVSQMNTCLSCSMKYYLSYRLRIKGPPNHNLWLGSAGHLGNEIYLKSKKHNIPYNLDYIEESISSFVDSEWNKLAIEDRDAVEKEIAEKIQQNLENPRKKKPYTKNLEEIKVRAIEGTKKFINYYEKLEAQPMLVEQWFELPTVDPQTGEVIPDVSLIGKIDLVHALSTAAGSQKIELRDHKYIGQRKKDAELKGDLQTCMYLLALKLLFGIEPDYTGLYMFLKQKEISFEEINIRAKDTLDPGILLYYAKMMKNTIENDIWIPNFQAQWHNYCDFKPVCERFNGDMDEFHKTINEWLGDNGKKTIEFS